jgi:hypothetical protein
MLGALTLIRHGTPKVRSCAISIQASSCSASLFQTIQSTSETGMVRLGSTHLCKQNRRKSGTWCLSSECRVFGEYPSTFQISYTSQNIGLRRVLWVCSHQITGNSVCDAELAGAKLYCGMDCQACAHSKVHSTR